MSNAQFILYVDARYMSPYAMSAYVALLEKGVPFELRQVDLSAAAQRAPDYARCSLTCRVPMLSHGDFHLSESSAIAEYLEDLLPTPGYQALYPATSSERARARQIQAWLRSDLMGIREARPTTTMFGAPTNTSLPAEAQADSARLCALAERLLPAGASQLFAHWSIADTDLALMLQRLLANGDPLPERLAAYARAQWQRPSLQCWLALERPC